MKFNIYLSILLLLVPCLSKAQVIINEYSASNLSQFADNNDKYEDWIELYNTTSSPINLGGWYLSDKEGNPLKWQFPAGTMIAANDHLIIFCSGRDQLLLGELHSNFKITQTKGTEFLTLSDASGTAVSSTNVELTLLDHSRALNVDNGNIWTIDPSPSFDASNNTGIKYANYTATPTINLEAGYYSGTQTVTIQNNEPNSTLYYTTDGTLPLPTSPEYTNPITVDETTVIKARSYSDFDDILPGKLDFNTYFINENFTLPVFSVAADEVQNLANGNGDLFPIGSIEYFDVNEERTAISYGELNRHGQDSWILPHRSIDWISRDEMGYTSKVEEQLFSYSPRTDHQRVMFRASGDDNYPANDDANHEGSCHIRDEYVHTLALEGGMKLDVRAVERVILFLNGEYWGLYGMRERPVDHDYTKEYYDQGKYNLHYLATWGQTWAEYGGDAAFADWGTVRDFALTQDMADSANYQFVKDNIQLKGLIDYMLINLNTVSSDWLNYNTGWWRGTDPEGNHKKWGYILWDNDASFDYYINYTGVPDISPYADPCDIDEIGEYMDEFFITEDVGKHEKIFLKLQAESEEFRQLYYSRSADLRNTVFSCQNMLNTFDRMVLKITPEMPRQIARWGGSMQEWRSNIEYMRSFIGTRCTQLDEGLEDCYGLEGPYTLVLKVEPEGAGEIEINTINNITDYPWFGEYFGNMDNLIEAKAFDANYNFVEWVSVSGNPIANISESSSSIELMQNDTLIAVFSPISSVQNIEEVMTLSVYPTLVKDFITIDFELIEPSYLTFDLYSILGQKLSSFKELNGNYGTGEQHKTVDISGLNLSTGVYFLNVNTGTATKTFKITVIE